MKKMVKRILGTVIVCTLLLNCFPVMEARAESLKDTVTEEVEFGSYNSISLTMQPQTIKVVLKEKGTMVFDFAPNRIFMYPELYNENGTLLARLDAWAKSGFSFSNCDAGTYYLRLWVTVENYVGDYTYFARTELSKEVSLDIGITLKKGQSVQLNSILANSSDKKIMWSSSKKSVATVSSSGKVKAVKKGTTVIKAYNSAGLMAKITVKVTN